MIELRPNKTYRIRYAKGKQYSKGDTIFFQTLDKVPEAKHLIKVKNLETGEIADLVELLAHPWDGLEEHFGNIPEHVKKKMGRGPSLSTFIPIFVAALRERGKLLLT